jgi:hypothetical protein
MQWDGTTMSGQMHLSELVREAYTQDEAAVLRGLKGDRLAGL